MPNRLVLFVGGNLARFLRQLHDPAAPLFGIVVLQVAQLKALLPFLLTILMPFFSHADNDFGHLGRRGRFLLLFVFFIDFRLLALRLAISRGSLPSCRMSLIELPFQ